MTVDRGQGTGDRGKQKITVGTVLLIGLSVLFMTPLSAFGWGFTAHKTITDRAIRLLPTGLQGFFNANRERVVDLSVEPDRRRGRGDYDEGARHYIDMELYRGEVLPQTEREAYERYDTETINKRGHLPWHTQRMYQQLVQAMRDKDYPAIVWIAPQLGHYVEDGHVPLHTTENYDGKSTGDTGVHARWESRLVDAFEDFLKFEPRPAEPIADTVRFIWSYIRVSHGLLEGVFEDDRGIRESAPEAGHSMAKSLRLQGDIVANRMNDAAQALASIWYTAWLEAGRPVLPGVDVSPFVAVPAEMSGKRVYWRGEFSAAEDDDWPGQARNGYARIGEYFRSKTDVRLASVSWQERTNGRIRFTVNVHDGEYSDSPPLKSVLSKMLYPAEVRTYDSSEE